MTDWLRPFAEIAFVAGELKAVRDAGFTGEALAFARTREGLIALCAFNGIRPDQAPPGWHYWPNASMKAAWERVIVALQAEFQANAAGRSKPVNPTGGAATPEGEPSKH